MRAAPLLPITAVMTVLVPRSRGRRLARSVTSDRQSFEVTELDGQRAVGISILAGAVGIACVLGSLLVPPSTMMLGLVAMTAAGAFMMLRYLDS